MSREGAPRSADLNAERRKEEKEERRGDHSYRKTASVFYHHLGKKKEKKWEGASERGSYIAREGGKGKETHFSPDSSRGGRK